MNYESKRITVLLITVFIIVSAFIPAMNPLPTINNATPKTPLFQMFTDSFNSSNSVAKKWFSNFFDIYKSEYLIDVDTLIFIAIGFLLVMLLIGVIILVTSKNEGVITFIRVIAVLNTLVYIALILLTFYQSNKLSNDSWGVSNYFIKITPSVGNWIILATSFVLAFIATGNKSQVYNMQNENFQHQEHKPQKPPATNNQEQMKTHSSVNVSEKMNSTKEQVENFLTNQKEKIRTEYETVQKDFKGLGVDDIISASREFCYRNRILKYIMPYIGVILAMQTTLVGLTLLSSPSFRYQLFYYITNSGMLFMVVVVLSLIKKKYLIVAIYESLLILVNLIVYHGFTGSFVWINLLVMVAIDVYAIKMILKNSNIYKTDKRIQEQIICPSCGKACGKNVNFCNECGNKLN